MKQRKPFKLSTFCLAIATALLVLMGMTPVHASLLQKATSGDPSGDGVQPVEVFGSPKCNEIGFGLGFKFVGLADGTFTLTGADGHPTGGAPSDPAQSVTFSNSTSRTFDWSASLGVDAVIVKGGSNANVYVYGEEDQGDTQLHAPIDLLYLLQKKTHVIDHVEFCYDYELTVEKTADTTFKRTTFWKIDKSVHAESWDLFRGDSGTSRYTVSVDRKGHIDSDWAVSGEITITNDTPFATNVTDVEDHMGLLINPQVDCGVYFPHYLASGADLVCTYSKDLPNGHDRVNTAKVEADGVVGGGKATADVVFDQPTEEIAGSINVVDSNGMSWGPVTDDAVWQYDRTFYCDADEGVYKNVATIVETGQSDKAVVSVTCRKLKVSKTVDTTYDRTYQWTLAKSADPTEVTVSPGQSFGVDYRVDLDAGSSDDGFAAMGQIRIENGHPSRKATLSSVDDVVGGSINATVDCPSLQVPAGGALECTYRADLADGSDSSNVATARLQNVAIDVAGYASHSGITSFDSPAVAVTLGAPGRKFDECVDVDDSMAGSLGTVCIEDAPKVFRYTEYVGPFAKPDDCGEQLVINTVSFIAGDTGATGDAQATVFVDVLCNFGCTLTPGYWKNHSEKGPAPYDDTWAQLPNGADTPFFLSGKTWYDALHTAPQGNAYYILAHAYMAATLNGLNGASAPPEVMDAWDEAADLFETYTPAEIGALQGNQPPRPRFLELAGLLDAYNNGQIGPGHCDEDGTGDPDDCYEYASDMY